MRICAAQTRPVRGDIINNITSHHKLIDLAIAEKADIIIFPELSITGYEPELAKDLATYPGDSRLDGFQSLSDNKQISIAVGMPIKTDAGNLIGMIIFQPRKPRLVYCKQYLHADEYPYFIQGEQQVFLGEHPNKMALSICYELSVPEHSENIYQNKADIYLSSVAKTADGVAKAAHRLSEIASQYSMPVVMANCIGHCDNFIAAGKSSAWNNKGVLLGQLDDEHEGVLIVDTQSEEVIQKMI